MKVYQLVAVGHLRVTGARHMVYSKVVYKTRQEAEKFIPDCKKLVTTPQGEGDLMVMTDNPLRVFVEALEVI